MNEFEIKKIPFMGNDLVAARDGDGQIWAGVSYICKGIGFSKNEKDRQVKNVQSDKILAQGCVKFDAGVFDSNNSVIALKLDFVPIWLAKISITPAMEEGNPELADKLMQYQLRAKDVLAAAFLPQPFQGQAYPPKATSVGEVAQLLRILRATMKDENHSSEAIARTMKSICQQFNIDLPPDFVKTSKFHQLAFTGVFFQE